MNKESSCVTRVAKRLLLAMLTLFPWLLGCTQNPQPPITLPFEVQKAGIHIETDMEIVQEMEYRFSLLYLYHQGDEVDFKRVGELAGDSGLDEKGELIKPGVPVLVKLTIRLIEPAGEKVTFEQDISKLQTVAAGSGRYTKKIVYLKLKPGRYHVSIESLKDVPKLVGTPVQFLIAFNPKP